VTDIPDTVLARAIEAAETYETLEFQIKAAARVIAEHVRAEERARADEIDEEKNDIEGSLEELTKENERLRAEVERLKACQLDLVKRLPPLSADPVVGQAFTRMLDAITLDVERSRAAQEERAAVVAHLRMIAEFEYGLSSIADSIEAGEHVK